MPRVPANPRVLSWAADRAVAEAGVGGYGSVGADSAVRAGRGPGSAAAVQRSQIGVSSAWRVRT